HSDWGEIARHFSVPDLGNVTEIRSLNSDPHMGGKSTWLIEFSAPLKVVYKPRSLATDDAWSHLLSWLSEHNAPRSAGNVVVLNRHSYGWMLWIDSLADDGELDEFFERFGATLCLAHLLNANDLHFENLVTAGGVPHIVDLETLFHPRSGFLIEEIAL